MTLFIDPEDGNGAKAYYVRPVVPTPPGNDARFTLTSTDGKSYTVAQVSRPRADGRRQFCQCDSFTYRSGERCKHIRALRALGLFSMLIEPSDLADGVAVDPVPDAAQLCEAK